MKPVIFGCAGPALSDQERAFFAAEQPAGFILFARNIVSPQQLLTLTTDLRLCVDRADLLVAVDQEGGRVQRLTAPHWRKYPPMAVFGRCAEQDRGLAQEALALNCTLIADDLRRVGINVDCLPLLDIPVAGSDTVIGDRAFSGDRELVAFLGKTVIDSLQSAGILPVMKHIPGHGRALVDSHHALPNVKETRQTLEMSDFMPFRQLAHCPLAMTAHIIYEAIDAHATATLSKTIIQDIIRGAIGFQGLLMTDDLSMKALDGGMAGRATRALEAGCDLILHCNGDMSEMQDIALVMPEAASRVGQAISQMLIHLRPERLDRDKVEKDYDAAMERVNALLQG